jgi:hypothetical protein
MTKATFNGRHAIVCTMPPSARSAAPLVAEDSFELT